MDTKIKERAPRNRTLVVLDEEKESLMSETISLSAACKPQAIENRLIHQDLFACIDFLPSQFIDLAIIDPPYNLNKKFGDSKFSKKSEGAYEEWIESWIVKFKGCLRPTASLYVCCDWQSSKAIQTVLEKHFVIRNRITWEREGQRSKCELEELLRGYLVLHTFQRLFLRCGCGEAKEESDCSLSTLIR